MLLRSGSAALIAGLAASAMAGCSAETMGPRGARAAAVPDARAAASARALDTYGHLPLAFEANRGQLPAAVRFLARAGASTIALTGRGATVALAGRGRTPAASLRLTFPQSRAAGVAGRHELPGTVSYLTGARRVAGAPTFGRVVYEGAWPGVDIAFYGSGRRLEYDLVVAPGADARRIRMRLHGQRRARIGRSGDLLLTLAGGRVVRQLAPVAYQRIGGRRRAVRIRFVLAAHGQVRIALGSYDHGRRLVVDPVLAYATYLGGSNSTEQASAIAVDADGSAYVAGSTASTNFTATAGGLQPANAGGATDAFVTKINPAGTAAIYSTYLGGAAADPALGIAVDGSGQALVAGVTASTNFPTAAPARAAFGGGGSDAFVAKLNATGTALVYSTYLGSSGPVAALLERGTAIAVDGAGNAYARGAAFAGFPTTPGASQATNPTSMMGAFVTKLTPAGALAYSTWLQGTAGSQGNGIAVDAAGDAYVVGLAQNNGTFPTTPGAYQAAGAGSNDFFVAKLAPDGSALQYSTLIGGAGFETPTAIALGPGGRAFVVGQVSTTAAGPYPTTSDAARSPATPGFAAGTDAALSVVSADGTALEYSTYLGGSSNNEIAQGVGVDGAGNAYVAGYTQSTNFPTTPGALRATYGGLTDGFLTEIRPGSSGYVYSSYVGGSATDQLGAVAAGGAGIVHVAGLSATTAGLSTPGVLKPSPNGTDALVARFDATPPATPALAIVAAGRGPVGSSVAATATLTGAAGPTGTMTLRLYGPGDDACASPIATSTATVRDNGAFNSGAVVASSAGTYRWVASYGGDPNNLAASSGCADPAASVVVASAPVATTGGASAVGTASATLSGSVDTGGASTAYTFEYGSSTAFGAITTPQPLAGSGSVSATLSGLDPSTTYYVRLVATNAIGTATGSVVAFTTGPGGPPVVSTGAATAITASGATLAGTIDPGALETAFTFEYGTTTAFGSIAAVDLTGAVGGPRAVALAVGALAPATTYRYRLVATNAAGTTSGSVGTFTTAAASLRRRTPRS